MFAITSNAGVPSSHLSAGRRGVSDLVGHGGEDGHQPALPVELLTEASADAAQQSGQKVLVASAELTVLQVVLQQPEGHTGSNLVSFKGTRVT